MKRDRIPLLEPLEEKVLLSEIGRVRPVASAPVASVDQGVRVTLSTNQTVYHVGQPVVMTLSETNTSNTDISVGLGPAIDGFYVTRSGRELWASNTGAQPQCIELTRLKPGQSITLSATWDGRSNIGHSARPTGAIVVHSQIEGAPSVDIRMEQPR